MIRGRGRGRGPTRLEVNSAPHDQTRSASAQRLVKGVLCRVMQIMPIMLLGKPITTLVSAAHLLHIFCTSSAHISDSVAPANNCGAASCFWLFLAALSSTPRKGFMSDGLLYSAVIVGPDSCGTNLPVLGTCICITKHW